jgi:hypothetical protein
MVSRGRCGPRRQRRGGVDANANTEPVKQMLARVSADLPRETNPARASDLRILKMRLETAFALAQKQNVAVASECAPAGATIH